MVALDLQFLFMLLCYAVLVVMTFVSIPRMKKNNTLLYIDIAMLVVFAIAVCTRPLSFRDTSAYLDAYDSVNASTLNGFNLLSRESTTSMEYGYVLLMLAFKSLGIPFRVFSTVMTVFFLGACYLWVMEANRFLGDEDDNRYFSTCFALSLPVFGFFYSFVAIRSMITFALLALASMYAMRNKKILTFLWLAIAFTIQRMAILGVIPIAMIWFWRWSLPKKAYLVIWCILGAVILVEFRTGFLINRVGMALQGIWNSMVVSGVTTGVSEQDASVRRLLLYVGYWLNGLAYVFAYRKDRQHGAFYGIYLMALGMTAIFCRYPASYRMIDYLFIYSVPLNYSLIAGRNKNRIAQVIVLVSLLMMLVSWGYSYYLWMLE